VLFLCFFVALRYVAWTISKKERYSYARLQEAFVAEANLKELTADIVAKYVGAHQVALDDLTSVISTVYSALAAAQNGPPEAQEEVTPKPTPAEIRKSIQPDYLVSFIDGSRHKLIRRHLTVHGYTLAQYKEEFGLPHDYPAVCPAYSKTRAEMAKKMGLGRRDGGVQAKAKG
jgi:predicted transcriptional regulator